jgi:hypothetical protein
LDPVKLTDPWKALVRHSAEALARARALQARSRAVWDSGRAARDRSFRLRLEAQQLRKISAHDMVPLELAVLTIFRSVYDKLERGQADRARQASHLDALAYTVAALRPLYAYEADGSALRRIYGEELSNGLFRGGGKEMHFLDGRCPIRGVAVAAEHIPLVIQALKGRPPQSR